jgi:hypothetical protein
MYRTLDSAKIIDTAFALARRIGERFPNSGLSQVAAELTSVSKDVAAAAVDVAKPNRPLRVGVVAFTIGLAVLLFVAFRSLRVSTQIDRVSELAQGIESAINDVVFGGIAVWFLLSIETRIKRRKVLDLLAQLRSLAHVIDMHQLTKDPDRLVKTYQATPSSPTIHLTPALLTRYLDYCSEMLAVLSKLAALLVQELDDPIALSAVNDLEDLASGLQRKVWQKIMIIDRVVEAPTPA